MKFLKRFLLLLLISIILTGCGNSAPSNFITDEVIETEKADFDEVFNDFTSVVEDIREEKEIVEYVPSEKPVEEKPLNVSDFTDEELGLVVDFIDVGQGDSILIRSGNEYALIDAGDTYTSEELTNFISNKTSTLKYFVMTHPHKDHIGGAPDILTSFNVENIIKTNDEGDSKIYETVVNLINEYQINTLEAIVGEEYSVGDASFMILGPNDNYENLNDRSIVVRLTYGDTNFLFTGDCENIAENDLMNIGFDISANVLKLGHHGAKNATSSSFLDTVKPSLAIISVGENNKYGHPHEDILSKLNDRNIFTYRTDINGTISVGSDGTNIYVIPQDAGEIIPVGEEIIPESIEQETEEMIIYPEDSDTLIVYSTRDNKYHNEGCLQLNKVFTQITLGIAKEKNLVPCSDCNAPKYK